MGKPIEFYDSYPIHTLYQRILSRLQTIEKDSDIYIEEYNRISIIAERSTNPQDKADARDTIARRSRIIDFVKNKTLVNTYIEIVADYVNSHLISSSKVVTFGSETQDEISDRVINIIKFFKESSKFVNLEWKCSFSLNAFCSNCLIKFQDSNTGTRMCPICYTTADNMNYSPNGIRNDVTKESTYKAAKNFRKEFQRLCGAMPCVKVGQEDDIRNYLYRANTKGDITREDIRNAISQCGYKNYSSINYLFSKITGSPLPPIDKYLTTFNSRFEKYYGVFKSLYPVGVNVTNIHHLIKLFLKLEGIPYDDEWFRTLSTGTKDKHEMNIQKVLTKLQEEDKEHNWVLPKNEKED